MVAAAVVGGAVIGAAGSAYAGSQAASATQNATNASISAQQQALAQQAQMSAPYRALGESAIPQLQSLLGLGGKDPTAALRATPGYQFEQQQGTRGTLNAASSMGMALSGNTLEGLSQFNQGLADTTYQQAVGNAENVVGLGQAAAAGQAANIGNAANNISGALINQGNNIAGIDANEIAGITKSIGNAGNQYVMANTLAGLGNPGAGGFSQQDYGGAPSGWYAGGQTGDLNYGQQVDAGF
jgi:hypothetical protein